MDPPVEPLKRLCGLETEYAIHFQQPAKPWSVSKEGDSANAVFDEIYASLSSRIPAATPREDKKGGYLANGCALWYEALFKTQPTGLCEGATPECIGPSNVVAASRGLDQLLLEATEQLDRGDVRLLKNCIDPRGRAYGAQENYEVDGFDLDEEHSWNRRLRILKLITHATFFSMVILPVPAIIHLLGILGIPFIMLLGSLMIIPQTRERTVSLIVSMMLIPKAIAVSLFCRSSKMGRTYRRLTPFVVSRVVFAGAGHLDRRGRFVLGQKAATRTADWFVWLCDAQRSIFCFNQIFKSLLRELSGDSTQLHSRRQRLCLAVGDSNMCEEAEYLRIATTSLVLDAIESGFIVDVPQLGGTLKSLRLINQNPRLNCKVETSMGRMTAIEIQQFYLDGCRRYLQSLDDAPDEAFEIITRWSEVLYLLRTDPDQLFGRVDWITKRELIRHAVAKSKRAWDRDDRGTTDEFRGFANLPALHKIDVKYHELSREGYYHQLVCHQLTESVFAREVLERAERMPPLSPIAAERCRYIREFTEEIEWVRWDAVKLKSSEKEIAFGRT